MGYLIQSPCGSANTSLVTVSSWVRCPTPSIPTGDSFPSIITIAGFNESSEEYDATYIGLNPGVPVFDLTAEGGPQIDTLVNNVQVRILDTDFAPAWSFNSNSGVLSGEVWAHIFAAYDASVTDGDGIGSQSETDKLHSLYVNGVNALFNNTDATFAGSVRKASFLTGISSAEFAFPAGPNYFVDLQPEMNFADTQIWLGTYIDGANISAFIDEDGNPVDPAVAAALLGEPTFLFRGDNAAFRVNGGAGGAVVDVGTITDFSPGP